MNDRAENKSDESNPSDGAQVKRPPRTLPSRPRRRRRWPKVLLGLFVLLLIGLLAVKPYLSQIVAAKLRNAVESRLHA